MRENIKLYSIKIPSKSSVFYCDKKKIILVKGLIHKKFLKINENIIITYNKNIIDIKLNCLNKIAVSEKKTFKSIQGTTASLIKKMLIESSNNIHQRLQLIGIGFRIFPVENFEKQFFMLKIGFSHPVYFKVQNDLSINCFKYSKILLTSDSHQKTSQLASLIKSYKKRDVYKGKGIFYENEIIKLKEIKKKV